MYSNDGFRELDRHECVRLLATASVGRVVFTCQALPAVLLSSHRVDGEGAVLVRTSEPARAVDGAVVARPMLGGRPMTPGPTGTADTCGTRGVGPGTSGDQGKSRH
ncbi:pyridoxamine 5'-phosphate oxidase family protein [Streptomyces actuosus]|uniref:Pyridoxamine 5'-phosphate oxidase family protein n=1 Tax=Streptomyces actuosus TaxID=1885 RepID=A0ABS2W153_STRAS|nr:pyridoxamine 5'-phosphate oxidase family protein [Streptomyces actuosus]